jgi:hypothetical protein
VLADEIFRNMMLEFLFRAFKHSLIVVLNLLSYMAVT